mgnify:CR=1 FL=1
MLAKKIKKNSKTKAIKSSSPVSIKEEVLKIKKKLKPATELTISAWQLYVRGFSDFIGMYLWGLLGQLPLIAVMVTVLVFKHFSVNDIGLYLLLGIFGLFALAWSIYYGTRAKIGLLLLIKNDFSGVRASFRESKEFFTTYLLTSLLTFLLTIVLLFCLVIPGIIVAVFYSFALFAVIIEKKRTFSAVERSYDLVKGYWWPVFGRILFLVLLAILASLVLGLPEYWLDSNMKETYRLITNVVWILLSPFFITYTYSLYQDLKTKK